MVREGRAVAVLLEGGEELRALRGVIADTAALHSCTFRSCSSKSTCRAGCFPEKCPRFSRGFGTFKVDYALSDPVPWSNAEARESAVVLVSEGLRDLARFTQEVATASFPEAPYLVNVGQQSLADSATGAARTAYPLLLHARAVAKWTAAGIHKASASPIA